MKKLLVIGAGIGQVPIINKAKEMKVHVSVVTQPGNQPGIALADEVYYQDIYERESIVTWAQENNITAVISDQNDLMMPTVAYVAEHLSIPGNTYEQTMAYCNKNIYRDNCDRIGNPVPKHIAVDSADYDFSTFDCPLPWIVKPADSQSSVGVKKIDKIEDLKPALEFALGKSKTHSAIVEEFFFGSEVVCEGFISDGKYYLLAFADRKYFKLQDLMIPSQTCFPSRINPDLLDKIVTYEEKMASYIKPKFAIVHSEYLINEKTGEIRVVESALRGGGVYISSHLIPLATGIDINEIVLKKSLGIDVDVKAEINKGFHKAAGYICFYLPEGRINSISGIEELNKLSFVNMICLDEISVGQKTEKMLHKGLRKGPIIVSGDSREELEENIKKVQETLHIEVINDAGEISGIIWS